MKTSMKTELWLHDFSVLFKNMAEFWPAQTYDNNRQINAIVRYIIYSSLILSYFYSTTKFVMIGAGMALIITLMLKNCQGYSMKEVMVSFKNEHERQEKGRRKSPFGDKMIPDRPMPESIKPKECRPTTKDNPHMNDIPMRNPHDPFREPCNESTEHVKKAMEPIGIYDDPLNRFGSMHNFHTVPKKDHEQFKDFMYGDMTMKDNAYYL